MASDEDYGSFLDQANRDVSGGGGGGGASTSTSTGGAQLKTVDADVPSDLKSLDAFYTSETDEPFEPVSLSYDGKEVPSEGDFARLVGHGAKAERLSLRDFDPRAQYKKVTETVERLAEDGEVAVFRVETGKSRVEYFVVGVTEGKLVGARAKAVES